MKSIRKTIVSVFICTVVTLLICSVYYGACDETTSGTCVMKNGKIFDSIHNDSIKMFDTASVIDSRLDTIAFLIAHRETGGTFNEMAVSKCGTYVGLLQMDCWWVKKANEYLGEKKYMCSDRTNGVKSVEIWKVHQYNRNTKIGLENSITDALEMACIIHSGGKRNERVINYYKSLYRKVCAGEIEYFDIKEKR